MLVSTVIYVKFHPINVMRPRRYSWLLMLA